MPNIEYVGQGSKLAKAGLQLISYSSRGFWDSTGGIDIAGPPTVADVSEVIDWAAEHTPADTSRVGSVGISYGAGISCWPARRTRGSRSSGRSAAGPT